MSRMVFINLPVEQLDRSIAFYEAIGCTLDAQFSGPHAAMMVWSETISFMLLRPDFFASFTPKPISDAHAASEVLICLSRDSRDEVDSITQAAGRAGGRVDIREPQDTPFMYGRSFEDPDGHIFEPMWMDVEAATRAMSGADAAA